jgi:hypothetical protein
MTQGIDVRFPQSTARVWNNILSGAIRERDGGTAEAEGNLSFGTSLGMTLTDVARELKKRLAEHSAEFPGLVAALQAAMDRSAGVLIDSGLGLGLTKTMECFPGLALGNLVPDKANCGDLRGQQLSADNDADFWGLKRSAENPMLGAIDFHTSPCELAFRIKHRPLDRFDICLK